MHQHDDEFASAPQLSQLSTINKYKFENENDSSILIYTLYLVSLISKYQTLKTIKNQRLNIYNYNIRRMKNDVIVKTLKELYDKQLAIN